MLRWCYAHAWVGWGGACWHSCEVEYAVDVTLNTLCMLRCRFGVGVGVGWGMLAFMWSWTRCGCYVEHAVDVTLNTLCMLRCRFGVGVGVGGAKAYKGLTSKFGLKHGSCNHAKGQSVRKFRRGRQKLLLAHTGAIDLVWRLVKQQVPGSLSSTVKGSKANPRLMVYARQWQWRFIQKKHLFEATGKKLFADLFKWTQRKEKETSFDIMQHQDVQTRPPENVVKTICFKNGLT